MPLIDYTFNTANNYTFDASKIAVTGGSNKLVLEDYINQLFTQTFSSSVGFTLDSSKSEFSSGILQQIDTRPSNALLYASYTTNKNLSWASGSLTGTLVGSTSVTGGYLSIPSGSNNYVEYNAASNVPGSDKGTIRIQFTPNYSGAPASNQYIYISSDDEDNLGNMIRIMQVGTEIQWDIYGSNGLLIKSVVTGNTFNPTAGNTYEIELNFNITLGQYRLFIDGVLINGLQTSSSGIRYQTSGIIRIGKDYTSSSNAVEAMDILDIAVFNEVQHTSNYTPDWTNFNETTYLSDIVTLPTFTYSGLGSVQSFDNFVVVEDNNPQYIMNGKYWDGSAWVNSDDSFAQSNTSAIVLANISTLPASDTLVIKIITSSSNTQMSVDNIQITYTGQLYPTDNPVITYNTVLRIDGLSSFIETSTKTGSDEITYILTKDNIDYYHDGSNWVVSDGTYTQSNTAADILTNIASFTSDIIYVQIKQFLHSNDGTTTPSNENVSITFNFSGVDSSTIEECTVFGYQLDKDGNPDVSTITIKASDSILTYKNDILIVDQEKTITPSAIDGYWEIALVENDNMAKKDHYIFQFSTREIAKRIPNEASKAFNLLANY